MTPFLDFLRDRLEKSGFTTEDTLASVLPLFRQAADAHDAGLVAPLDGVERLVVNGIAIGFDDALRVKASARDGNIEAMNRPSTAAFDVMSTASRAFDVDSASGGFKSLDIADPDEPLTEPRYVPGYRSWEHLTGHHDPLADQMVLGMVLASVACGFDFTLRSELEEFVHNRRNLFAIAPKLNPVLAQVIVRMTELDRHRRARDLREMIRLLETYRDQQIDFDVDLSRSDALRKTEGTQRRTVLLERLQERLFEISRRNRLLYFKPSQKYLNLTIASVPALFDVRGIQPEQLMTWNRPVEQAFLSGKPLALGQYLRFEDAAYLPGVLDSIIAETRRDEAELGFSQLRVVLCFLRWHDLKEAPKERIDSPLLLLNVKLTKKKGVRDSYTLQPVGREAEVNPVLRYHLRTLYGINLPESVELAPGALDAFHALLSAEVRRSEPGVTIEKIERPHVEIIHDRARRRLDQYKRRQRPTRQRIAQSLHDLSYSYRGQVDPLGLKMFQKLVFPSPAPMRELVEENPILRNFMVAPAEEETYTERERTLVSFAESTSNNPYRWDFDLCNLTLGNFKYRKMTLVRDYETLLSDSRSSRPFDAIFSLSPRPEMQPADDVPMEEQHTIVECDPTQASAIAYARRNDSYIIQGPPGTGKSQTITNLIADYVARGKRVLFVCEKRAALDVVYHRLRQKKLESLCCLIHDSQDDKKEFIADLRTTYEGLLQSVGIDGRATEQRRRELIDAMRIDLGALSSFDARMRDEQPVAMPLRALLARGVELQRFTPSLSAVESERIPGYGPWIEHARTLKRVDALLHNLSTGAIFGSHPLRRLTPSIASRPRPHEFVTGAVERIGGVLDDLSGVLAPVALGGEGWDTLANVLAVARYARQVEPLVRRGTYGVLDPRHSLAHALDAVRAERADLQERLDATTAANQHWREKLTAEDAAIALDVARSLEGSILRFFKSEFWQLRKTLGARYDFQSHAVKPRWTQILQRLHEEHELQAAVVRLEKKAAAQFRFDGPLAAFLAEVESVQRTIAGGSSILAALHAHCLDHPAAATTVARLVDALRQLESIEQELGDFLVGAEGRTVSDLGGEVREVSRSMHLLNETLPVLGELAQLPAPLASALRDFPLSVTELEAASARRTIHEAFTRDAALAKFTLQVRERHLERLWSSYRELQRENARNIVAAIAGRFRANVARSSAPAAQLSRADMPFKKRYSTGRRELEHEFGKSMRYRSIRDLFSGPAGDVMLDLKPVWLMSPLSVSDTLPLDTAHFDVVIFDEASQIPLEEAIPSIFRADQIIVVGDQMQLPPTSFFSSKPEQEDEIVLDDDGDTIALNLDSDSFLNHAARNLRSTMLGWHYRSRSESLISYSNAAFYQGRLLTVPDRAATRPQQRPITAGQAETGFENVEQLLDRSLSFHAVAGGIYEDRRNTFEAFYVAQLVRGLLLRGSGESIGIIAFSEAQQGEIERALGILADEDPEFAARLEAEYAREEDDQFIGLLVKNLENIQGDERDVIILSVCYGRNRDGRMLMNFGPINQSGGEKRLNVAFSRAKKHMALVSSIRHPDITNTYNDGANALRRYLKYAEAVSVGDETTARAVLRESGLPEPPAAAEIDRDAVVRDVADALRAEGYEVTLGVGQSHFRCDVAVKKPGEAAYRAAILIDTDAYYRHEHVLERDLLRPVILENFGWRVLRVLTKDWYEKRDAALEQLIASIESASQPPEPAPLADAAPEPLPEPEPFLAPAPVVPVQLEITTLTSGPRRFELVEGSSSKFWEIQLTGVEQTVRFGRIGTSGQIRTKTFADEKTARLETDNLIREKVRKGYHEIGAR
jgi:predicted DNA-binding WGR domain protein/sulfur carrier protein ThiS